ncbi:hypothetical protein SVXNc_0268 [Candidatus Nanohalococcus occultus]|uniref:Secreted protein n=2 Tax=Candidatus Nanohalococcus occultus TaxID=2978047 RepID=A0ABY8CHY1_9ARCH|nr:hypothetical protein SVXNc_0268 [Candidatus Nanohaloarchaeota archaeon SVXNc]
MIAFTMAIASLFSGWIQQTQAQSQEDVDQQREQTLSCNQLGIDITDANAANVTVEQVRGDEPVGNVSVRYSYSDGTPPEQGYLNISTTRGFDTDSSGSSGSALESVSVASTRCSSVTDEYTP